MPVAHVSAGCPYPAYFSDMVYCFSVRKDASFIVSEDYQTRIASVRSSAVARWARALVLLITPVCIDIGLVSCVDDIILEVT
jgi:hypothetical protein